MRAQQAVRVTSGSAVAQLATARGAVAEARAILASALPRDMEACDRLLQQAASCLRDCGRLLPQSDAAEKRLLAESARSLKQDIARLAAATDQAMSFWLGWLGLLGSMQSGYTVSGRPAEPKLVPRLHLDA